MKTLITTVSFVFAVSFLLPTGSRAQSDDILSQAGFGWAVAISGGDVLVGEPLNNRFSGHVYVFRKDNSSGEWTNVQVIAPDEAVPRNGFGSSIAADGDVAAVLATEEDADRIYVLRRNENGAWAQEGVLRPDETDAGAEIGESIAVADGVVFATLTSEDGASHVVVFEPTGRDEEWIESGRVDLPVSSIDNVPSPIVARRGKVYVGAPGVEGGAVFVLAKVDQHWNLTQIFQDVSDDTDETSLFGAALATMGDRLVVGAPEANGGKGAVFLLAPDTAGKYKILQRLTAPVDDGSMQFGTTLASSPTGLQVTTYDADEGTGAVYRFEEDDSGLLVASGIVRPNTLEEDSEFATSIDSDSGLLVVGAYADLYGYGSAFIYEPANGEDGWVQAAQLRPILNYGLHSISGDAVKCSDGKAGMFGCSGVDLLSFISNADLGNDWGGQTNDVWGWTDPESGREYAIVCTFDATVFIDIGDPANPVVLGSLPMTPGTRPNYWRDAKTYKHYAYIVADNVGPHGLQIFDLSQLRDVVDPPVEFEATARYDGFDSAHNIIINESTGFAYVVGIDGGGNTCGGGSHILDLKDPLDPKFVGCFAHEGTGETGTGYTHDSQCVIYHGPDERYTGREICIGANETAISIADFTDKSNIIPIAVGRYPNVSYAHQGWLTEDHRYFFQNDETDEINGLTAGTRTLVWDLAELDDPVLANEHVSSNHATDHNYFVKGMLMYQSNYLSGLRIFDVSNPEQIEEVGHFDTVPWGGDVPGLSGSWGNYPFLKSGVIVVTSLEEGVFFLKRSEATP